jgi:hypothetical protein
LVAIESSRLRPGRRKETVVNEARTTATGPATTAELGDWYATFAIRGLSGPRWRDRKAG